jgi:FkbM family methyltransferase
MNVMNAITETVLKFRNLDEVCTVWEIGTRDGKNAALLGSAFPSAQIHAFEPNPHTFHLVAQQAENSNGKIIAYNLAISGKDGAQTFLKIDTRQTLTTRADGNPGASSFFLAKKDYEFEKYAQTPVEVQCNKPLTLILESGLKPPSFLWIDVQGSELNLLKGFGDFLNQVDFIYIELSIESLYQDAPLVGEVVAFLSTYFYWHRNVTKSTSQINALFVSKRIGGVRERFRHLLYRISYSSKLLYGISDNPFPLNRLKSLAKKIYLPALRRLFKSETSFLWRGIYRYLNGRFENSISLPPLNPHMRQLLSVLPPSDPLQNYEQTPPEVSVVIPVTEKDFDTLHLCIDGISQNCANPIHGVTLVCPQQHVEPLAARFPQTSVLNEDEFFSQPILSILSTFPESRIGWFKQQLIKFLFTLRSDKSVLVVDGDTVLLQPKTWVASDGTQALDISHEFHTPYVRHFSQFSESAAPPWSFVTHHQLMQPKIVSEFLGSNGERLPEFLSSADKNEFSSISEYHSYGAWLFNKHPNLIRYSGTLNRAITQSSAGYLSLEKLKEAFPDYSSVSFHKYVER